MGCAGDDVETWLKTFLLGTKRIPVAVVDTRRMATHHEIGYMVATWRTALKIKKALISGKPRRYWRRVPESNRPTRICNPTIQPICFIFNQRGFDRNASKTGLSPLFTLIIKLI
jgi:hypothetical protein